MKCRWTQDTVYSRTKELKETRCRDMARITLGASGKEKSMPVDSKNPECGGGGDAK